MTKQEVSKVVTKYGFKRAATSGREAIVGLPEGAFAFENENGHQIGVYPNGEWESYDADGDCWGEGTGLRSLQEHMTNNAPFTNKEAK